MTLGNDFYVAPSIIISYDDNIVSYSEKLVLLSHSDELFHQNLLHTISSCVQSHV